mgnify:CR=1 FL=1
MGAWTGTSSLRGVSAKRFMRVRLGPKMTRLTGLRGQPCEQRCDGLLGQPRKDVCRSGTLPFCAWAYPSKLFKWKDTVLVTMRDMQTKAWRLSGSTIPRASPKKLRIRRAEGHNTAREHVNVELCTAC